MPPKCREDLGERLRRREPSNIPGPRVNSQARVLSLSRFCLHLVKLAAAGRRPSGTFELRTRWMALWILTLCASLVSLSLAVKGAMMYPLLKPGANASDRPTGLCPPAARPRFALAFPTWWPPLAPAAIRRSPRRIAGWLVPPVPWLHVKPFKLGQSVLQRQHFVGQLACLSPSLDDGDPVACLCAPPGPGYSTRSSEAGVRRSFPLPRHGG